MNVNIDMDWTNNPDLNETDLNNISSNCGYDILIGTNNGEEVRRAYQTKPWKSDFEIYNTSYIDLGLPSGLLWATENIKDSKGNELYFAWGETTGYTTEQVGLDKYFSWSGQYPDYKFGVYLKVDSDYGMTKYNNTDRKTVLEPEDDAATVNWGYSWRMPTYDEFRELLENTKYEWTSINGISGAKFISMIEGYTDKFLFFPAIGSAGDGSISNFGIFGFYLSSSLNNDIRDAWALGFGSFGCQLGGSRRYCGCPVRPVFIKS